MTLLYASTFADALGKLAHQEQKQVKITTVDLMMDPKGLGLSLERLNRAADNKVWSARVSRDLRIIMRRDGEDTLLAYVGHHDDAYAWAERRKFVEHERTGAMQIVQVVERREEERVEPQQQAGAPTRCNVTQPFWALTDDQLLDVGVPRDWLEPVREMVEEDLDNVFEQLPAEAAEALYDFATGGKLEDHIAPALPPNTNAFMHPDAKRRFRVLDNVEELQAALDAPFEKWAVFLHPVQRELAHRDVTGPTRITGSAGTGKTIVALHRATHLARTNVSANVLLTTFSKPLADALSRKLHILTEAETPLRERLTVRALDQAVFELYAKIVGQPNRATTSQIRALIGEAQQNGLGQEFTPEFLFEEWAELVDAWNVLDADNYASVPRIGRRTRLGSRQRESAWGVFEFVWDRLAERKLLTKAMIYSALSDRLQKGGELPFTHVVVDEAQDLSVSQVRFLASAINDRPDGLFLAGDIGQRIFRLPFSWAKLGLDIRGRSHRLRVNYRTSHQIRSVADRLLPPAITDADGLEDSRIGTVSVFDGPEPDVRLVGDEGTEQEVVAGWLETCVSMEIAPAQIGILVRSKDQVDRARNAARSAGLELHGEKTVVITTMHNAKGLEFRAVAVMACDEDVLPDANRISSVGDPAELEALYETERHLLYVACTRARDRLLVSGVRPGSEFLDDLASAR